MGLFALNHLRIGVTATFLGGILAMIVLVHKRQARKTGSKKHDCKTVGLSCVATVFVFLSNPFKPIGINAKRTS